MLLATRNIDAKDTIRYVVSYKEFLYKGTILETVTATSSSQTSSVAGAVFNENKTEVIFYVTAGVAAETFTVTLVVSDNNGQTVNDTVNFNVVLQVGSTPC